MSPFQKKIGLDCCVFKSTIGVHWAEFIIWTCREKQISEISILGKRPLLAHR